MAALAKDELRPALSGPQAGLAAVLLGWTPSFIGGVTVPLGFLAAHPRVTWRALKYSVAAAVPVLLAAEFIELRLDGSTFDWIDLVASLAGLACSACACVLVLRKRRSAELDTRRLDND
jgi:hypothetical protein